MILPIYAYGQPVLKKKTSTIDSDYPDLKQLIDNMFETMYNAKGVGLAAPQIGRSIRLFIVDTIQLRKDEMDPLKKAKGIKQAFINAEMIEETGDRWEYEEGCLSIPNIHADVDRQSSIKIKYMDTDFQWHTKSFDSIEARVIQHEYDHVEGILFLQHIKPLKRRLLKRRLDNLQKGIADTEYPLRFAKR